MMGTDLTSAATRASRVLAQLLESQGVELWAVKDGGDGKIRVGTFRDLDAASDKVDLMQEHRIDQGDTLRTLPAEKKTPEALIERGCWPDKWWAHAVDEAGREYRYTNLVWMPLEPGDSGRQVDVNQTDDRPRGDRQ